MMVIFGEKGGRLKAGVGVKGWEGNKTPHKRNFPSDI